MSGALRDVGALLRAPTVSDVLINGPGTPVWVDGEHGLQATGLALVARELELLVEQLVGPTGLRVDRSSPVLDARLADGSRLHVVVPPVAVDGPYVAVRRFRSAPLGLADFAHDDVVGLLEQAVVCRSNIVVSGRTGAGKTSLLNALAGSVVGERIVTIEDAAELRLATPHVVRLEARRANAEGAGEVSVRDLVRAALRMRPDRIVIGEIRGSEAFDVVQAMNTGHDGSLTTCHANGPADTLRRLETMVLGGGELPLAAVREQLLSCIDLVVHVERDASGERAIASVAEPLAPGPDGWRTHALVVGGRLVAPAQRPVRAS